MPDQSPIFNSVNVVAASSGVVLNTAGTATLPASAGKVTYIQGITISSSPATSANVLTVTVTGLATSAGGTLHFLVNIGTTVGSITGVPDPQHIPFPLPLPASAQNTAIVVTIPAAGGGNNGGCAVVAYGFQV